MAINAGDQRHRVTLMANNGGTDKYGQLQGPNAVATIWASVKAMTGSQVFKAQQFGSKATHIVKIRYRDGVQSSWLVKFNNRLFEIQYIQDPDERKFELELYCVEKNTSAGSVSVG